MNLIQRLTEARQAQHELMTGTAVVEVLDQNGERVKYNPANANRLATYIQDLERQVNEAAGRRSTTGPMQFWGT